MKRVLLCAALLAWSGLASAVVYKWIDGQGKLQYGDRPPDGVHAQIVEGLGTTHGTRPEPARPPAVSVSSQPAKSAAQPSSPQDSVKQTVDEDVAQVKDKQCADAQARYKSLIEGRKLYKAGADGERQYLTSEEIDAERINAKRDIDAICNSPT
jgi:hypothetical protein